MEPAYEMMETHPDWAPSLHLGHSEMKVTDTSRHGRLAHRAAKREHIQVQSECLTETAEFGDDGADCSQEVTELGADSGETELEAVNDELENDETVRLREERDMLREENSRMKDEINRLLEENRRLKEKLIEKEITVESFEQDSEKVRFYTGLPSFATFLALLSYLTPNLPQGGRRLLTPFQMLVVVFMRLRLNLPVQHIAYLFGLHRTTVASTFKDTLGVMYSQLLPTIIWPDRDSLRVSMPHQFVEAFGNKVAVIIDCFEIFMERPSNLHARAVTFSHYKHNNTMKYLIGITPKGMISFISKGWGGRASDRHITEESGFLNKLLPGDLVLADRGFDIAESVGMMCAEVKIPAFTRGKCQMEARSIEETRKLAHLRIHVERVIGNLCGKYQILAGTMPIDMVLPCEGEDATFLDKIVHVCCALTNMSPSVVQP